MPRRSSDNSSGGSSSSSPISRPVATSPTSETLTPPIPKAPSMANALVHQPIISFALIGHVTYNVVENPQIVKQESTGSSEAPSPARALAPATMDIVGGGDACCLHSKAFHDCISKNGRKIKRCQAYIDMLSECCKNPCSG